MRTSLSRRDFAGLLGLSAILPFTGTLRAAEAPMKFRVRTITAGLQMKSGADLESAQAAVAFLKRARGVLEKDGYQVQTLRLATQPLWKYLPNWSSMPGLQALGVLDQLAQDNNVICSIGPVITGDHYHKEFAAWAAELVQYTKNINFSCRVASAAHGLHLRAMRSAAEAIAAIARATPGGEGNFRFAATAFVPSGTPFFPAAFFDQGNAFSLGLESPNVLAEALQGDHGLNESKQRLRAAMQAALDPLARHGIELARNTGWRYLGIDASPAPGLDASIGRAIETLTHKPFGGPSTLMACAAITGVLKGLDVQTCGYSGLMLPVLEDPVLAQRAAEGKYGVYDLLLYSSVCGTGLDVVPIPGDTSVEALTAVIGDVAALATKYHKPLSARLLPLPGKQAGEQVSFDNPHLTKSVVMQLG